MNGIRRRGDCAARVGAAGAVLAFLAAGFLAGGQKAPPTEATLHYPILSHADWWQSQYGSSKQAWADAFGADYQNGNSGPACAVMVIHYKKRARISSDLDSFSDPRFPKVRTELRWKFCRANQGKGYGGGFADDDGAEASGRDLAEVLQNEDIPVVASSGTGEAALSEIAAAIGRYSLVVCRIEPAVYFADEAPGRGRWVVVYGIDAANVSVNDPGRPEGRTKKVARRDFAAALQKGGGGPDPTLLECVVMVGNYLDGWHADGRSRMFVDYYKKAGPEIGFPHDNGGNFGVHTVGPCIVQDYLKPAGAGPEAKAQGSVLFMNQAMIRVFWVKGAFFEKYFSLWGFEKLGPPISDDYSIPGGRRQDFEKGSLIWNGKDISIRTLSGEKK